MIEDKLGRALVIAVLLLILSLAGWFTTLVIGAAFPHTCIIYSAECQRYRIEQCVNEDKYTLDECIKWVKAGT